MIDPQTINGKVGRLLENELRSGEHIVWCQQPHPEALARKSLGTFLFGIPFFAFAVLWTFAASGGFSKSPTPKDSWPTWFPVLWGGMFIIVGAGLLFSPVWAYWKALRTVYAITDQRAIILSAPRKRIIFSFVDQQLLEIHRVEDDRGRGDIVFHRQARSGKRGDYYYDTGFLGIDHVREAEVKLRELYEKGRAS